MTQFAADFSRNTQTLIELLKAVDFSNSQLPGKILEDYQPALFPGPPTCKMHHCIRVELPRLLRKQSPEDIQTDYTPIDQPLIMLATRLERYVRLGEAVPAEIARDALERGIRDIRCGSIPLKISQEEYVSIHGEYLNNWLVLLQEAEIYDQRGKSLLTQQEAHDQEAARLQGSIDHIRARVREDPEFAFAFFRVIDHKTIADRSQWTSGQWDVHRLLVQLLVDRFTLNLSKRSLERHKNDQLITEQHINTLKICLREAPIVTNPSQMQDLQNIMEDFTKGIAVSDVLMAENLHQMEQMSDALQQHDQTSGVLRQRQTAMESARKTLMEMRQPPAIEHKTTERSNIYGN